MSSQLTTKLFPKLVTLSLILFIELTGATAFAGVPKPESPQKSHAKRGKRNPSSSTNPVVAIPACTKVVNGAKQQLPQLAWTFASYNTGDLTIEACKSLFSQLFKEGFKSVVYSPSYKVSPSHDRDAKKIGIDASTQPSQTNKGACLEEALKLGLSVGFKPHLDPSDMPRARMDFDPAKSYYYEKALLPQLELITQASKSSNCHNCNFTLYIGAELATSDLQNPESWITMTNLVNAYLDNHNLRERVHLTDDVMFDVYNYPAASGNKKFGTYLSGLDSVSISQYTQLDVYGRNKEGIARALEEHEKVFRNYLESIGTIDAKNKQINLGEFGIGTGGLKEPWNYGQKNSNQEEETGLGIEGMLLYMKNKAASGTMQWINLWTIGPEYDFYGIIKWSEASKRYKVADIATAYNKQCP